MGRDDREQISSQARLQVRTVPSSCPPYDGVCIRTYLSKLELKRKSGSSSQRPLRLKLPSGLLVRLSTIGRLAFPSPTPLGAASNILVYRKVFQLCSSL